MKKVNEVSRLAGVSRRTLQYYDDEGILEVERSKENYRLYDDAALETVWKILLYREMGFELREIKHLLTVQGAGWENCLQKRINVITLQIQHLNEQIKFISFVMDHGIPPASKEKGKAYVEQITDIKGKCIMSIQEGKK